MIFGIRSKVEIKMQPKIPEDFISFNQKCIDQSKRSSDACICKLPALPLLHWSDIDLLRFFPRTVRTNSK